MAERNNLDNIIGFTNTCILDLLNDADFEPKSGIGFFDRYVNSADPLLRLNSIIGGSVISLGIAAVCLIYGLYLAGESLYNFVYDASEQAQKSLESSAVFLLLAVIELLATVVGPVINLLDLMGGGVKTLLPNSILCA